MSGTEFIVVGAGSGGCAAAARLREAGRRVHLLEAGGPDTHPHIQIPVAFGRLFGSEVDWAYQTEPQAELNGRRLFWPRGKVLGGSSSINAMIYIRGHRADYDGWAAAGNRGWSYDEVLPYFKRSEDFEDGPDAFHGAGGPLHVEHRRYTHPICDALTDGFAELGYPRNDDFNAAQQEGFGRYQVTMKGGERHSTAAAYLRPALALEGPGELQVTTGAHVTRLLLRGGRAVGVAYRDEAGAEHELHAEGGVILTAGAVTSPHLLLLSGIGPADELRAAGVEVQCDLPGVGQNLQDHLIVPVVFETDTPGLRSPLREPHLSEYEQERRGLLVSNVAETGGFLRTSPDLAAPDLQFHHGAALFLEFGKPLARGHHFTLLPTLLQPHSRGQIRLASADPLARPLIEPNYLSDSRDLDVLLRGIELAREVADTAALTSYRRAEFLPGAGATDRAALTEHVREHAMTIYHPVGTCRMGHDDLAVVGDDLRVRGVDGLWIADASVMPTVPRGNTNAPTIMVAEKAADLILGRAAPV